MNTLYLISGIILMFGAGELFAEYRTTGDRKALWMSITGALIGTMNLLVAAGYA